MGDEKPRSGGLLGSLSRLALGGGGGGSSNANAAAARTPSSDTLAPEEEPGEKPEEVRGPMQRAIPRRGA